MTKSLYIIGGAGSGKSTFMKQLLERLGQQMGPLVDLHKTPNARGTVVTLRGHVLADGGIYLGHMRTEYPGTDGLDRASSITGEKWLLESEFLPPYIIAEGATLATRRFLNALNERTDLLLSHLVVEDFVRELRFAERGSTQDDRFVQNTVTRSANLFKDITGCWKNEIQTDIPEVWDSGLRSCIQHLSH